MELAQVMTSMVLFLIFKFMHLKKMYLRFHDHGMEGAASIINA